MEDLLDTNSPICFTSLTTGCYFFCLHPTQLSSEYYGDLPTSLLLFKYLISGLIIEGKDELFQ